MFEQGKIAPSKQINMLLLNQQLNNKDLHAGGHLGHFRQQADASRLFFFNYKVVLLASLIQRVGCFSEAS